MWLPTMWYLASVDSDGPVQPPSSLETLNGVLLTTDKIGYLPFPKYCYHGNSIYLDISKTTEHI